jgi:formylglycine-generating enzyme required for sulfatase activity/TolB-like protein/tetratricopeptide (TPR) repeat protein
MPACPCPASRQLAAFVPGTAELHDSSTIIDHCAAGTIALTDADSTAEGETLAISLRGECLIGESESLRHTVPTQNSGDGRCIMFQRALGLIVILLVVSHVRGFDQPPTGVAAAAPFDGSRAGQERDDNAVRMKLVWCPPGSFTMGSPVDEEGRGEGEDQVDVTLTRGFWIGKHEVTQKQWQETLQTDPWRNRGDVREGSGYPATWMNWGDAELFCEAITEREHAAGRLPREWEYSLPTEAQWEYAARAGVKTRFQFAGSDDSLADHAWTASNAQDKGEPYAHEIGRKKANPWGLYDLHGNVQEWCRDAYTARLAGGKDPLENDGSAACAVVRGGDWQHGAAAARLARRESLLRSRRDGTIGLRVAVVYRGTSPETGREADLGIAVVPFENTGTSVETSRLGAALSEMLADDLAQIESLHVLERNNVGTLIQERALAEANVTVPAGNGRRSAKAADYLLTGSFRAENGKLVMSARLKKPGFAKPRGEWKLEGPLEDFLTLERDMARQVITGLGVSTNKRRAAPSIQPGVSPTLAILPLTNHSPDVKLDQLGGGLADVLQASLSAIPGMRLVDREKLMLILAEQKLSASGLVDPKAAAALGKLLHAQRLLLGSFLELAGSVCLQTRLIDTETGTVLASHKLTGRRDAVAEMIEGLTLKTVSDLAIRVSGDAEAALRKTNRARTLEGLVHQAASYRLVRQGKFGDAADVCQRAILVEPGNIYFYRERCYLLKSAGRYEEILQTADQARARPEFATAPRFDSTNTLAFEITALNRLQRHTEAIEAARRYAKLFPDPGSRSSANDWIISAYNRLGRGSEVEAFLVKAAEEETDRQHDWRNYALRRLYSYYLSDAHYRIFRNDAAYDPEASKAVCRKAIGIYNRVLKSIPDKPDVFTNRWAQLIIPNIANLAYLNKDGNFVPYFTREEQAEHLRRGIEAYHGDPVVAGIGRFHLARILEQLKQWEPALEAYRDLARGHDGIEYSMLPSNWDLYFLNPQIWIDRKIESYYRVARILHESLGREDEAREAYREMVREVGLAHFAGADAIDGMHRLGIDPEFPEQCVLLWGGETSAALSWRKLLEPAGYKVHTLRAMQVNPPQLAPYSVVILIRSGNLPFTPRETLALRSYAAAGGSLLAVISTGWEPAPPGIHNPLLSFFGMECQMDPTIEAHSTRIVPHPITTGIARVTARNAIHIDAPPGSALIEADDKVVLAAAPYRFGRVVVAAFGQWYLPDTSILPRSWRELAPGGRKENIHQAPIEFDARLETPLLRNVLTWLTEPRHHEAAHDRWRQIWREAQMTARKAQAHVVPAKRRLIPWNKMAPAFERLISAAPDAIAREESLWLAGEAFQQMGFFYYDSSGVKPRPPLAYSNYGYDVRNDPLLSEPRYYRELLRQFPDSPLRPYAEWRLAECERRNNYVSGLPLVIANLPRAHRLLEEYQKVNAPARSYARTWTNLRRGAVHFAIGEFEDAASRFQEVAETMPTGPEKLLALLNLGLCYERLNKPVEGRQAYEAAIAMPVLQWFPSADWFMAWGPICGHPDFPPGFTVDGDGRDLGKEGRQRLQKK